MNNNIKLRYRVESKCQNFPDDWKEEEHFESIEGAIEFAGLKHGQIQQPVRIVEIRETVIIRI